MMGKPLYMDVARDVLEHYHPDARCAFVAGSITRGQGGPNSDIDLVVLYADPFDDIHRNTIEHQGWLVELFVQNEQAQDYFMHKDIEAGACTMPHMIAHGIAVGPDVAYAMERQRIAKALIDLGPPPLDQAAIDLKRYAISGLIDDLRDHAGKPAGKMVAFELFRKVIDFYLRANNHWSGDGKWLIRRLNEACPNPAEGDFLYADDYLQYALDGKPYELIDLALGILEPYGGYLQAGYRAQAPDDWRGFIPKPGRKND